jgi:hypothetical protein
MRGRIHRFGINSHDFKQLDYRSATYGSTAGVISMRAGGQSQRLRNGSSPGRLTARTVRRLDPDCNRAPEHLVRSAHGRLCRRFIGGHSGRLRPAQSPPDAQRVIGHVQPPARAVVPATGPGRPVWWAPCGAPRPRRRFARSRSAATCAAGPRAARCARTERGHTSLTAS